MNLIVDIGNTSTKLAVFDKGEKLNVVRIIDPGCRELEKVISGFNIDKAIISTVKKLPSAITGLFSANIPYVHLLSHKSKLPFRIEYETPETLGPDRISRCSRSIQPFSQSELLVIDAGTAITYDFLSEGVYKGGNISPGLNMRLMALNKFTDKLPLLTLTDTFTKTGRNTKDAIMAGVITGVTYEINEYIRTFEKKSTDFNIILTGGDSGFLKDKIDYQCTYMPDIVIDGLNYILEYNAA